MTRCLFANQPQSKSHTIPYTLILVRTDIWCVHSSKTLNFVVACPTLTGFGEKGDNDVAGGSFISNPLYTDCTPTLTTRFRSYLLPAPLQHWSNLCILGVRLSGLLDRRRLVRWKNGWHSKVQWVQCSWNPFINILLTTSWKIENTLGTFTQQAGGLIDQSSALTPFRKSETQYWTSNDVHGLVEGSGTPKCKSVFLRKIQSTEIKSRLHLPGNKV